MLKLFGAGRPDHPMADPREARRILEELPAQDPCKALEELAHWHESVGAAEGFRLENRIALHLALDDAAQPRLRKLARDYCAAARPSRVQENRLWTHCHDYWRQAGVAFARCVESFLQEAKPAEAVRTQLPALLVRTLRSLAQHLKWMHLRYGPVDPEVWGILNRVYALAESRGAAATKVAAYAGQPESTPRQEFLKAAIFSASSPDSLLPREIQLAEHLIGEYSADFAFAGAQAPELPYWTDLARPMAPLRVARAPQPGPGVRFLGGGAALASLQGLIQKIEASGQVPAGANLGDSYEPEAALDAMQHLAMHWSPVPPERRHPRHSVKSRLAIVQGFDSVRQVLLPEDPTSFQRPVEEAWIVENVSAGGFGAVMPQAKGDWLKVGALVGMQPEGGPNWIAGMIRRVNRLSGREARVGIQTLSKAPQALDLALRGARVAAILLPDGEPGSLETSIALKPAIFAAGANAEAEHGGRQHLYIPQGVAERGEDYEIVRFREMIREA